MMREKLAAELNGCGVESWDHLHRNAQILALNDADVALTVFENWLRTKPLAHLDADYERVETKVTLGIANELAAMKGAGK